MNAALWAQRIQRLTSGDGLRAQLLRGGVGSLAIKAAHAVLAFVLAVVLARTLGPEGYGVYSFALAIIMLSAIPAQVGVPQLVVRETAKAQTNGSYGLMRGLWRWGNLAVLLFSALALAVVAGILWFMEIGGDGARVTTLAIGVALIPVIALANVRGACLRGLRKVVQGQLPESIIRPALLLFLVLASGAWFMEDELTPQMAMRFYVLAAVLAFIIGAWLLRRSRPAELGERPAPEYQSSAWRKAIIPLAMITGLQLINNYADLLILGFFRSDEEVGVYRAAFQVSMFVIFGLQAFNQMLQPYISRLYELNEINDLEKLMRLSVRFVFLMALLPVGVLVTYGSDFLSFVFGSGFRQGSDALAILSVGQLLNASMGLVGMALVMSGFEKDNMVSIFLALLINVILTIVLVPSYGLEGAASGTLVSFAFLALSRFFLIRRRLGISVNLISFR